MDKRTKVYATGESYSSDDDSYLGYSMISGDFNGDGEEDVAVGMPRGAGLLGKVVIYKWNMANQFNVTGRQIGAYFGYSICTSDVDGDKLDDLIIGAPMYTEQNNEGKYDVGRVYILLQGQNGKFEKYNFRDGFHSKSRFGTAVTSLGDINQDGFGDFAIGAPYDGVFGRGAVYIYHGASEGPRKKYSQVILAEDIKGDSFPRTFGFSLAGGMDMDGNIYPDLAVGAYDSDTVFIFKSRPVAVVDASTQFISVNKLINLDNKACVSRKDGKRVACAEIESCWRYEGVNVPSVLDFDISWLLDSKNIKSPRMFFIDNDGKNIQNSSIRLEYGRKLCQKKTVYVIDNIRDKLTPLEVEVRYRLFDKIDSSLQRERRNILMPIIDQNRDTIQRDSLNIQKNCGIDNVCIPDLNLNIKTIDKFLLGSKVPLEIEILITNKGEDAFETAFYASIPSDLDFKKIQQIGSTREPPITCTAPSYFTNYTLKCDIGNPFMKGTSVNFKIVMMPSQKIQMAPSYNFYMEVNSTNPEREGSNFDNVIKKRINVWIKTDVVVEGLSHPDGDHYKAAKFKFLDKATSENDLGPHLVHIYNVRNNGPSAVEEAILYIHWPYKTLSGKTLMYVMNKPETSGNIICDPSPYINSKNLDYDISLSSKSFLVSTGAIVKSATNFSSNAVKIEQSHKFITSQGVQATNRVLTEEEKRKFAEEDSLESTGDASLVHSERAKETSNRFDKSGVSIHSSSLWSSTTNSKNQPVNYGKTGENKTFIYDEAEYSNLVQQTPNYHRSFDNMAPLNYDFSEANGHISKYALNYDKNKLNLGGKIGNSGYEYSSNQNKYMSVEPYPGKILETYDQVGEYRSKRENMYNDYEKLEICKTVQCGTFRCVISNLGNNDGIWIAIRARLVAKTLESLAESVPINVSTLAIVHVTKLPYIGNPTENIIKSHEIYFKAIPEPISPIDTVPLWVVVLSACAGAIILLLLVFLLYKCGFFNRNRPSNNCQERQPLNSRNGYHGDEHL